MAKLIALTPIGDLLPRDIGGVILREVLPARLMSVAPFAAQEEAVGKALGTQLPACNRRNGKVIWWGNGTWMVEAEVPSGLPAAVTDQTDAWAVVQLSGGNAETVLARLVPVDLRASVFAHGHVAKTMLAHLSVTISRPEAETFEIMVMRSMAATLVHDLVVAMQGVAAREKT